MRFEMLREIRCVWGGEGHTSMLKLFNYAVSQHPGYNLTWAYVYSVAKGLKSRNRHHEWPGVRILRVDRTYLCATYMHGNQDGIDAS